MMEKFIRYEHIITDILYCGFVSTEKAVSSHKNRPSHGLAFFEKDAPEYVFEGMKPFKKSSGVILYMPKGSTYHFNAEKGKDHICFAINFQLSEDADFNPFIMELKNISKFRDLFYIAVKEWRTKQSGYKKGCKSYLYDILRRMEKELDIGYVPKCNAKVLSPAINYIHKNYTGGTINIPSLSAMCNISEGYFRRLFKEHTGTSPINYIRNLKINYARELLLSDTYNVKDVAELCGYSDTTIFSREFKKMVGILPSKFREGYIRS